MTKWCTLRPGAEILPGSTLYPCSGYYLEGHYGVTLPDDWTQESGGADGWSKETGAADGWTKET